MIILGYFAIFLHQTHMLMIESEDLLTQPWLVFSAEHWSGGVLLKKKLALNL